ncbi:MAG: transporter [Candidatus Moduliflexus flocculans]|nr:transporter [Candidatus Moduliflexus flocculans]
MTEDANGLDRITGKIVYEQRFGARNMWEVVLPFGWSERLFYTGDLGPLAREWGASLGDAALAVKRCFYHNLRGGSILSGAAELILPTGDRRSGFGKDTFIFEPFVTYGQLLPAEFFLQAQAGLELPFSRAYAENESLPPLGPRPEHQLQALWPDLVPHGRAPVRQRTCFGREDRPRRRAPGPGDGQQAAAHLFQRRHATAPQPDCGPEPDDPGLPDLGLVRRRLLRRVVRS